VSCVYPVLMSFCDVRAWAEVERGDRVKQKKNVKQSERETEKENKGKERESAYVRE